MEIAGIELKNGDEFDAYSNWVGSKGLKHHNTLRVVARPSNGKGTRYAENRNVEQMLYDIELRNIDDDPLFPTTSRLDLALFELNRKKAEWVIGIVQKLQSPKEIQAELEKTDWIIARFTEPYSLDMHDDLDLNAVGD